MEGGARGRPAKNCSELKTLSYCKSKRAEHPVKPCVVKDGACLPKVAAKPKAAPKPKAASKADKKPKAAPKKAKK
jgi:hypothetical protein